MVALSQLPRIVGARKYTFHGTFSKVLGEIPMRRMYYRMEIILPKENKQNSAFPLVKAIAHSCIFLGTTIEIRKMYLQAVEDLRCVYVSLLYKKDNLSVTMFNIDLDAVASPSLSQWCGPSLSFTLTIFTIVNT